MTPTSNQSRLLEHVTSAISDLRADLAKRITDGNAGLGTHMDRMADRLDEYGDRLAKVETRVELSMGRQDPNGLTKWKRDGALVLSGGGIIAVIDAALTWLGTIATK